MKQSSTPLAMIRLLMLLLLIIAGGDNKLYGGDIDVYARALQTERSREYDAIHYRIKLRFDEDRGMFWGQTTITLRPLRDGFDSVSLDAEKFVVSSVEDQHGKPLEFNQSDGKIVVSLEEAHDYGDPLSVTVSYSAKECAASKDFPLGISFVEATEANPRLIQALSFPTGARHWFPCYDHPNDKATIEVIATVREGYEALSNGKLLSVTADARNKTQTFHWLQDRPHSTYLTVLAAGPYQVIEDSLGDLAINYWVYPQDVNNAWFSFCQTPDIIAFFNREFGYEYPWDKYDQVTIPGIGGGAECTSATLLGHGVIHDEKADKDFPSHKLIAHEAAHQWWGDLVTLRDWGHTWINESFGTYSDHLYIKHSLGADEGAVDLLGKKNAYLREAHNRYMRPIVFHQWDEPGQNFDSHTYPKGAAVINMMRWILGDEPFRKAISHFLHKHAYAPADTHDFITAIKEMTGQNLDWFFEQWLFSPGHPVFEVSYHWDRSAKAVKLNIAQAQDTSGRVPLFKTPVVIAVVTAAGKISEKVWLKGKVEEFDIACDEAPLMVRFDEGNFLLKEWTFEKTTQELIYQLKHDDVIGRMWAASELGKIKGDASSTAALLESGRDDLFWSVRRAAIEALGTSEQGTHESVLKQKCLDQNSRVRAAALQALGDSRQIELVAFFAERFEKDNSYVAQAAALRSIGKCGDNASVGFLDKAAAMKSHRNILKNAADWALKKVSQEPDE
ncbi:MAG: M1 family metallopeptidase [Phycisphaeraceae bacterium]|nr:M1 family metallopeptidase [Phycisphaeraceae bacterium]